MTPPNFPVGRLRLSERLSRIAQGTRPGRPAPLLNRLGGVAPKGPLSPQEAAEKIQIRDQGTLSQFLAAKKNPTDLRTQHTPFPVAEDKPVPFAGPQAMDPAASANVQAAAAPKLSSFWRGFLKEALESKKETRAYKITGRADQLDELERAMWTMDRLGSWGSSRTVKIFYDGDGAARMTFERQGGRLAKGEVDTEKDEISFGID